MTPTEKADAIKKPICFVVMPVSDVHGYESGHFGRVYEHLLKPSIINAGYTPIRADDTVKTDYIVVSVIQRIVDSEMVLCDLSARNPNVMYELGIRHAFNKPVALVKDRKTDKVFDIQGLRYIEYDDSLRIDAVHKDMSKIAAAVQETENADPKGVNSVVQLAGIKVAEAPATQNVSGETQLLLSAIAALEKRIDTSDAVAKQERYFLIKDDMVTFPDRSQARLDDDIYEPNGKAMGTLVDIHPAEERIYVKREDGKVIPFSAISIKSKGLTAIPF